MAAGSVQARELAQHRGQPLLGATGAVPETETQIAIPALAADRVDVPHQAGEAAEVAGGGGLYLKAGASTGGASGTWVR